MTSITPPLSDKEKERKSLKSLVSITHTFEEAIGIATENYSSSLEIWRDAAYAWIRLSPHQRVQTPNPADTDPENFFSTLFGEDFKFAVELADSAKALECIRTDANAILEGKQPEEYRQRLLLFLSKTKNDEELKTLSSLQEDVGVFAERINGLDVSQIERADYRELAQRLQQQDVPNMQELLVQLETAASAWADMRFPSPPSQDDKTKQRRQDLEQSDIP